MAFVQGIDVWSCRVFLSSEKVGYGEPHQSLPPDVWAEKNLMSGRRRIWAGTKKSPGTLGEVAPGRRGS
jgi:hypothetical protein